MNRCAFLHESFIDGKFVKSCVALTKTECQNCRFYKTREQLSEEQARSADRLARLGKEIPSQYMPW